MPWSSPGSRLTCIRRIDRQGLDGRRRRRTPVIYTSAWHPGPVDLPSWRRDDGHGISRPGGGEEGGRNACWSHPSLRLARSRYGWSRQWASGREAISEPSSRIVPQWGCVVSVAGPRFLPEVAAVSSLSTFRHLARQLGDDERRARIAETGRRAGGCLSPMQRHTSLSSLR